MSIENNKTGLPCEVVQDLMPLYHDGILQEQTEELVKEHLEECEDCRIMYERDYESTKVDDIAQEKRSTAEVFAEDVKRRKRRNVTISTVIGVICGCLGVLLVFALQLLNSRHLNETVNLNVDQAFQYDVDGDERLFVIYSVNAFDLRAGGTSSGSRAVYEYHITENGDVEIEYSQEGHGDFEVILGGQYHACVIDIPEGSTPDIIYDSRTVWAYRETTAVPEYVNVFDDYWALTHFDDLDGDGCIDMPDEFSEEEERMQTARWFMNDMTHEIGIVYDNGENNFRDREVWNYLGEPVEVVFTRAYAANIVWLVTF